LFNMLVDLELSCLKNIRKVLFGGERVSLEHSSKALAVLGKGKIIHVYGPTETTVYAAYYFIDHIEEEAVTIPIGKPIANTTVYILDRLLNPVPPGVFGEIYIGGDGVARGYLNNPELTGEKFKRAVISQSSLVISSPSNFSTNDQCPMTNDLFYKTGDLARWLPGGNVEFLGRMDRQLKIRGFRVELGEIENILVKHKDIKEAVVIAREDKTGDKYLCAYLVPHQTNIPKGEDLSAYLSRTLPGYMIPLHFLAIEKIPLTINGKVDRKALPLPGALETRGNYTAPNDEMEEKLVELWALVLGIEKDKIGIDDHFFRLGGHSLRIVLLAARIHKEFNVMIAISKFFEIATVRILAQYIRTAVSVKYSDIDPVEKKDYYPMAPAQKRMYILQEINPGTINYNMPLFTKLEGPLEKIKLENAFKELIYRHESLRTSFHMMESKAVQRIHDEVNFEVEYYETGDEEIIKKFIRPFDLSQAPFLRVRLLKKEKENHLLLVDMHHSISDGRSLDIFLAELFALYRGEKMQELRLQYKDFSEWLDKPAILDELRKQEAYWLNRLAGDLPALKLPSDFPRPNEKTFAGAFINFEIPWETGVKLRTLAKAEEATMFMVILTVFSILLFKLCRQEDIALGTLVAGRRHVGLAYVIGMFVNTLVLRIHPGDDKTFKDFLREAKKMTLEAFDNQDYPFDDLVEKLGVKREAARNPVFDVLFLFNSKSANDENNLEIPGLQIKPLEDKNFQAKFDLLFTGKERGEKENLFFSIEYSTELFKKERIERFISYFKQIVSLLKEVNENEDYPLKDIGIAHDLAVASFDLYRMEESGFEF